MTMSSLGWILVGVYPKVCNIEAMEFDLNFNIKKYFEDNGYHELCKNQKNPYLKNLDGKTDFPRVSMKIIKIKWQLDNSKMLVSRTVGQQCLNLQ